MKRKSAKELLAESFRELAEKKSVEKITVRDITENCGYSTATFYRQFRDKYDLIAWDYAHDLEQIMASIDEAHPWRQTLLISAKSFVKNREYLANLLLHTSGHDSFLRNMTDLNYAALKKYILSATGSASLDKMTALYARLYCLGTVNLSCEWIMGEYRATPEEMAEIYENSLPEPLRRYLIPQ